MQEESEIDYGEDHFFAPEDSPSIIMLFNNISSRTEELQQLYNDCKSEYTAHGFYRFYHGSHKVYSVQNPTLRIVTVFRELMPDHPLNEDFEHIISHGTGLEFSSEVNENWTAITRPILEAYFHAMMFLECMLVSIKDMDIPRRTISEEWGAVLYLYNLRYG